MLSMKASGQWSIGLASPSIIRRGWARPDLNFVVGLHSYEPYGSYRRRACTTPSLM